MFLTQLAAIGLHRAGQSDPLISEDRWRELFLGLTEGTHEPWSLVVADLSKPAFFQPPVPEGSIDEWSFSETPDDVDVLVTAKGHDVKPQVIHADEIEAWVYALCTLQTMQGYPGRGYNGIARMNGGYGNRPRVGLAADHRLSSRFLRDVSVLLHSWQGLLDRGFSDKGVGLVWTQPWDGQGSLAMHELTPHFIEVCQRVRCQTRRHHLSCCYTTTRERRCVPEIDTGDVGDAWIPVERVTRSALTVGKRGLDYRLLARVIFGEDFLRAPAQESRPDDQDPILWLASALARGQGKTEGLHMRALPLTGEVRRKLGRPDDRSVLGRRASQRVVSAATMRTQVLYRALADLPLLNQLARERKPMRDRFDSLVDDMFFDHLFETLAMNDDEARIGFDRTLEGLAWGELQRLIDQFSGGDTNRFKAISDAERTFWVALRKNFPDVADARVASEAVPA
jgi:CRISPR system Cascade subunit CasA